MKARTPRLHLALRMLGFGLSMLRSTARSRRTVVDLIERQAARRPDHPFVRFEGRTLTYGEYDAAANRVAHWTLDEGIDEGASVALLMHNRPEFLVTWAGLAKAGVVTALINTNLTGRALAHVLAAGGVQRIVVGAECVHTLATLSPEVLGGLDVWVLADPAGAAPPANFSATMHDLDAALASAPATKLGRARHASRRAGSDLFYIYTSGTTGLPKAARFSHMRFLGACVHSYLKGFGPHDTMYCALPLYHTVGGIMAVSAVLTAGGTLALRRRFSASRFWDDVGEMNATAFVYIGELCRYLVNQPPHPGERRHRVRFVVGNGLRPDVWPTFCDRFGIRDVVEFYGATEANVTMMNLDGKVGSVGKLPPGVKGGARMIPYDVARAEHLRDPGGRCVPCGVGEVGELIGRIATGRTARGRFEGYTSAEANEKKILRDVFTPGDAWFRSGDLLRFDTEGYFYFVDRIGDTFRWKGENVSTQEVAEALSGYEGVELCTVYGVEIPGADGRAGMAALAVKVDRALDGEALFAFARDTLPSYAMPVFVRLKSDLDVTGTFKLRKVELQREGYDPTAIDDPLFVRDDAHEAYVPLTPARHRALTTAA